MTQLAPLHSHLSSLRRGRWLSRFFAGLAALALVLLGAVAIAFLTDWTFELGRQQRIVLLTAAGVAGLWALWRYVVPPLVTWESEIDVALLVERQHAIDTDLVAALQFEAPAASGWGSPALAGAVVERVAGFGNRLNVRRGLRNAQFLRRVLALSAAAGGAFLCVTAFPRHAAIFYDRMLLGSTHYPTATQIVRIAVNGAEVFPAPSRSGPIRVAFGQPVKFEVTYGGAEPRSGRIQIAERAGSARMTLPLAPGAPHTSPAQDGKSDAPPDAPAADDEAPPGRGNEPNNFFSAEFPRLVDEISFQAYLGDAWTDPLSIEPIPLPAVTIEIDYVPPAYARGAQTGRPVPGALQVSVVEGSQVTVQVTCGNKPLEKVQLAIDDRRYPLSPQDESRRIWVTRAAGTPLERIEQQVQFEIEALDDDGLSPESPLRGVVRVQPDRPPRVAAAIVTDKVLPGGKPGISYGASDDFGLAEVRLRGQITRTTGEVDQASRVIRRIPDQEQPEKNLRGRYSLDLGPLSLSKGDEVRVIVEAVDYRGDHPGATAQSEPLILRVTDESGVLSGLFEDDEKLARQLEQIIERQLGVGETR